MIDMIRNVKVDWPSGVAVASRQRWPTACLLAPVGFGRCKPFNGYRDSPVLVLAG